MEYRTIEWDRAKLYEVVWEKSTVQLAKEYGIPDVALAKICKKLRVPKPGLGYWRRKERGFKVARTPLPPMEDPPRLVSRIPTRSPEAPEDRLSSKLRALAEVERAPDRRITVVENLSTLDSLAEKSLQALMHGKPNDWGYVRPRAKICLDVVVTQPLVERAIRIVNAVLRGLTERGHKVLIEPEAKYTTTAVVRRREAREHGRESRTPLGGNRPGGGEGHVRHNLAGHNPNKGGVTMLPECSRHSNHQESPAHPTVGPSALHPNRAAQMCKRCCAVRTL